MQLNSFNYNDMTAKKIAEVKSLHKQQANNDGITLVYNKILSDTKTAVNNIDICLQDDTIRDNIYQRFCNGDISFLSDILGVSPRGHNNTYYREYLTELDRYVIGIRIGNHFETRSVALDKSNNAVQYLMQVVLIPTPPLPTAVDCVDQTKNIGNIKILTQGYAVNERNWGNFIELLKKVADYLTLPDYTYDDTKQVQSERGTITCNKTINNTMNNKKNKIRLTESQLHNIIKESVKNLLKEETYEFDDSQLFPQAVELAIELSDALRKIKIDTYGEKTVCIPIQQFSYIEDMSSQLHEIMHQLEEQSAFPRI